MNTTKNRVASALDGTKTAENLKNAFIKEAEVFARNSIFADVANKSGDISAWKTLLEHADNDKHHAELWLSYLDEIGDTFENLTELADIKSVLDSDIYPLMADIADDEGFEEIAEKMRLVSAVKKAQGGMLKKERDALDDAELLYSESPETKWLCRSCGYTVSGNMPPERCPLCTYPKTFSKEA